MKTKRFPSAVLQLLHSAFVGDECDGYTLLDKRHTGSSRNELLYDLVFQDQDGIAWRCKYSVAKSSDTGHDLPWLRAPEVACTSVRRTTKTVVVWEEL